MLEGKRRGQSFTAPSQPKIPPHTNPFEVAHHPSHHDSNRLTASQTPCSHYTYITSSLHVPTPKMLLAHLHSVREWLWHSRCPRPPRDGVEVVQRLDVD